MSISNFLSSQVWNRQPNQGRGGLEDTSSNLKTIWIIQRDANERRYADEVLRSGCESPADRS